MKSKTIIGLTIIAALMMAPAIFAEGEYDHEHGMAEEKLAAETTETVDEETGLIYVNNKLCPVSGEEVGAMGEIIQQEYEGKVYNFCCKMCQKDFNKDPEKYVKIVEEQMAGEAAEGEMHEHAGEHMHEHQHE